MGRKPLLPTNLRPSRADPEARRVRKELEKQHNYEWVPPILLGLLGITLAFDVAKDVEKHEERHKKREEEGEQRRKRRDGSGRNGSASRYRGREEDEDDGYERRRRRHRRDEEDDDHDVDGDEQQQEEGNGKWVRPADIDVHNDYERLGGGMAPGMERAERRDGGLGRADRLERGEALGWERDMRGERVERRRRTRRRSIAYEEYPDYRQRLGDGDSEDEHRGYEEEEWYGRGRRALEERRSRPRPRRRSSDW